MEPSAAASQQALENGLTMESSSAGENGRERTESEATLLARASTDISGTLQPLMPSAKTENVNKSAADIWDEQAAELLPGAEAIGRDNRGALHHVGLGAQEGGETKVQQKEETPKAEQKSRSQEILIRSLQANKPLIAIPGVPEARDRNGQPLPPPTLPSSIRPCVDGEHLKEAKAPEEPHKDVLGTIGSNELLFAACVLGLGCAGYLLGSLGASMIWIPITAVIGALAIRNWRAKEEKKAHFEHHMIEGALALGSNIETAEWANFLIAQIWNILDPDMFTALLDQIEDQSNLLAKDMLKGLAFHISVRDFELGPHPPRITAIQVFPAASGEDSIVS